MAGRRAWYVTLDATGTLLKPAEPPGETYLRFWEATSGHSFSSSRRAAASTALTAHFPGEFNRMARHSPNFGSDGMSDSAFPWWRQLVLNVMKRAEVADCLRHNEEQGERFARELYAHFARPEAWTVFTDVRPTLDALRRQGIPMGVISNFDERLHALLVGLELRDYFEVVTTSFGQSKMKPHASIFHSTFAQLQREDGEVDASSFLHVGDHLSRDFKAAKDIGAQALLLWRSSSPPPTDVEAADVITTLEQIVPTK